MKKRFEDDLKLSWNTFEIKQISDGQQEITLYFMDRTNDSHGSRYKASKNSVQLEIWYISDRGGMGVVAMAMLVSAAIQVISIGYFFVRAIRGTRGRSKKNVLDHESTLGP